MLVNNSPLQKDTLLAATGGLLALTSASFADTSQYKDGVTAFLGTTFYIDYKQSDSLSKFNSQLSLETANFEANFDPELEVNGKKGVIKFTSKSRDGFALIDADSKVFEGSITVANKALDELREKYPQFRSLILE